MSIYYTSHDRTPYTYLIGWSSLNKWYYGVRYRKGCHPSDLWVTYFTSSKRVAQLRIDHGDPDIIQIRKTFNNKQSAINHEYTVLKRMNVLNNDRFINCAISRAQNGKGAEGTVAVFCPITNKKFRLETDSPRIKSGEVIVNNVGKSYNNGFVNIITTSGEIQRVTVDEFKEQNLTHQHKFTVPVKDAAGNTFRCDIDDPRYINGELLPIASGAIRTDEFKQNLSEKYSGKFLAIDKNLIVFHTSKDDPRFLAGEIVPVKLKKAILVNTKTGEEIITYNIRQSNWRAAEWVRTFKSLPRSN